MVVHNKNRIILWGGFMQFSTYIFVLAFLPLVVVGYFGANRISKNMGTLFLIAASCIFFLYSGLTSSILFGISIAINYLISIVLRKSRSHKKIILSIGITLNVLLLLYFKYFNFFIDNINAIFQQDIHLRIWYFHLESAFIRSCRLHF